MYFGFKNSNVNMNSEVLPIILNDEETLAPYNSSPTTAILDFVLYFLEV